MVEERKLSVGRIAGLLCINWFFSGFGYLILFVVLYGIITSFFESAIIKLIIILVLFWLCNFLMWVNSIAKTREKTKIDSQDVPKIMNRLILFVTILCLFFVMVNSISFKNTVDETINNDLLIHNYKQNIEIFGNIMDVSEYEKAMNERITEVKTGLYLVWILTQTGTTAVEFSVLPLVKKRLLKSNN